MASNCDNLRVAWVGDYDSLKRFVGEDLKLNGIWDQPGGDKKIFRADGISISWRKTKSLLHLEGAEAGSVTQQLFAKICNNTPTTNSDVNTENSNSSCEIISQSSPCKCTNVFADMAELKDTQSINNEAVLALSNSVSLIAETMRQFHEDFVKSCATDMHNLTHAQTIKVNEANDSNAPDVSVIETSCQNNAARMTNPNNAVINDVSASGTTSQNDVSASGITPKSMVPCPFLRRKNYCLKGSKCDFSHANPHQHQHFQAYQQQYYPPPFYRQTPYHLQSPPTVMRYPYPHPYMNYPHVLPLMDIPTRPPRRP